MAGYELLAPEDDLTLEHVNERLMAQVRARVTSSTRPTAPEQGQSIYETDTGQRLTYDESLSAWIYDQWITAGLPYHSDTLLETAPTPVLASPPQIFDHSLVATVTNASGGFNVLYSAHETGFAFANCVLSMHHSVGDSASNVGFVVPILDNCDLANFNGQAFQPDGSVVANGDTFRLNLRVVGC